MSVVLSGTIAATMLVVIISVFFLVCRHHSLRDVDKVRDSFNVLFLPFRPPFFCSMYWPAYLLKMMTLVICFMAIDNRYAHAYIQLGVSIFAILCLFIVRAFKLWSVYILDMFIETVDLLIVVMNVFLVHGDRGDAYSNILL
jgi:hypothetical protein